MTTMTHWQQTLDSDQVLWVYLDRADRSTNTLNLAVMQELEQLVDQIAAHASAYRGVIFASKKTSGFIAGADIEQFKAVESEEQALQGIEAGQALFAKLEALPVPTVAMIAGFCLGGGLEFALACRYRVAQLDAKTKLGLPEVKLGLQPGWGGSVRLPKLIGPIHGLDLILTGRMLSSKRAKALGLVDAVVPERMLCRAAKQIVLQNQGAHRASRMNQCLNSRWLRPLLAWKMRREVAKVARSEHYPAPYAMIDNWLEYGVADRQAYTAEAHSMAKLFLTDTSKNLVRVFFLQEMLKGLAKQGECTAKHVHVIGAGTMGGDIAAWCAWQGFRVTLQDRDPQSIAPAMKRAASLFKKKARSDRRLATQALDRLIADPSGDGVAQADVIIEAVFEDLTVKQQLFKQLEAAAKPDAILASNTSSIPLEAISSVMQSPDRLVGIHFFNPVAKMFLIEVVQAPATQATVVSQALAFVGKLGKLPLPTRSTPGFLVNRVLMPYLMECVSLLEEGYSGETIDLAAKQFGMPLGPVELADVVGLDVCLSVAKNLTQHFGGEIPGKLVDMVEQGQLGVKTKQGFYRYDKQGKAIKGKPDATADLNAIADRLIQRMIDEAKACLEEQVVENADLLDAGMIFATGFAPFRGGLLHYAASC